MLTLGPVNKSGCYRVNDLATFPISSLWRGIRFYFWITIQAQELVVFLGGGKVTQEDHLGLWVYFLVERIKL